MDIPVARLNDITWLIGNVAFNNDKYPAYTRLVEMLSTEPEWKNFSIGRSTAELLGSDQSQLF